MTEARARFSAGRQGQASLAREGASRGARTGKQSLAHGTRSGAFLLALAALGCLLLSGCRRDVTATAAFYNENDALRRERNELIKRIATLEQTHRNLEGELTVLRQRLETEAAPRPGGLSAADAPRLTRLAFGRYTGTLEASGDQAGRVIRIYLQTLDQHGRFLPVTAVAEVQAVAIVPGASPVVLAEMRVDAKGLDAAYRSGLAGTHYTIDLPQTMQPPAGVDQATVKVTLHDAATGAKVSFEQAVSLAAK